MTYPPHDPLVIQVASVYGLRTDLLSAQIIAESAGRPDAFRWEPDFYDRYIHGKPHVAGARFGPLAACSYGLLQILLETALEHGFEGRPEDLFVPRVGLNWGAKYLRWCLDASGQDHFRALQRYNGQGKHAHDYAVKVFTLARRTVPDNTTSSNT